MSLVVVGGHTRNIGKTSVVAELIAAMPERRWTAVKITQYGHGVCSANGEACDCVTADHTLALSEERDGATGTDSSRYLAAGAAKSYWLRTQQGMLAEAMPKLRALLAAAEGDVILESNSVLRFLRPDFFVSVLDAGNTDFKVSALRYVDRADALIVSGEFSEAAWDGVSMAMLGRVPRFGVPGGGRFCPEEVVGMVRMKLGAMGCGDPLTAPGAGGCRAAACVFGDLGSD